MDMKRYTFYLVYCIFFLLSSSEFLLKISYKRKKTENLHQSKLRSIESWLSRTISYLLIFNGLTNYFVLNSSTKNTHKSDLSDLRSLIVLIFSIFEFEVFLINQRWKCFSLHCLLVIKSCSLTLEWILNPNEKWYRERIKMSFDFNYYGFCHRSNEQGFYI